MTTPSDVIGRMMSTPVLKGFIEVPVKYSYGISNCLLNVSSIVKVMPFEDTNDDASIDTKTHITLLSRSAQSGGQQVVIAAMSYAETRALLLAAQ
jgi:hypothetical protein